MPDSSIWVIFSFSTGAGFHLLMVVLFRIASVTSIFISPFTINDKLMSTLAASAGDLKEDKPFFEHGRASFPEDPDLVLFEK